MIPFIFPRGKYFDGFYCVGGYIKVSMNAMSATLIIPAWSGISVSHPDDSATITLYLVFLSDRWIPHLFNITTNKLWSVAEVSEKWLLEEQLDGLLEEKSILAV